MKPWDLVVVGGGPAGSTLATLVKRHDPSARVLLLERERFPRHHIGESLLPGMIPVLKEMGAFEKIDAAGFPRKFGAVFVWGRDREPWDADFNNLNLEMLQKYGRMLDAEFSWQCLRSRYDEILLDHAASCGVEVRQGWRAAAPLESAGRVVGLVAEGPGGRRETLRAAVTADCSGQAGFLAPVRRTRKYRADLRNVAAYAYFRGAKWKFQYQGHPDKTKIFICSVPEGWFWYIPIAKDLVSVGLVSKASEVKRRDARDMRAYFLEALARCGEIAPLLKGSAPAKGIDPARPEKDFYTLSDWSYLNDKACGPGWLAAGDAAFFIDPLLSSGVMMAHLSGHRAAYTVLSARREADPGVRDLLWGDYDRFCKEVGDSFLSLVQYWYGHEPNARAWWKEAKGALQRAAPVDLDDKMSFVAVAAGLTYHFERAYTSHSMVFGSSGIEHSWQWEGTKHELKRWTRQILAIVETGFLKRKPADRATSRAETLTGLEAIPDGWTPRWRRRPKVEVTFLPVSGEGRLRPIHRLVVPGRSAQAARPKRVLPLAFIKALRLVDGKRTVGELRAALKLALPLPAEVLDGQVFRLLKDLSVLGALELRRGGRRLRPKKGPRAWALFREGESALMGGDPARGEALLDSALRLGVPGAWPLALRGEARRHLGRTAEALSDLDAALRALERAPARGTKRLAALIASFDAAVSRGWVEDRLRVLRAKLRLESGDHAGARVDADAALELNPRQSEALILRAKAKAAQGDEKAALLDVESAMRIEAGRRGEG